jgi:hypothetical protein
MCQCLKQKISSLMQVVQSFSYLSSNLNKNSGLFGCQIKIKKIDNKCIFWIFLGWWSPYPIYKLFQIVSQMLMSVDKQKSIQTCLNIDEIVYLSASLFVSKLPNILSRNSTS